MLDNLLANTRAIGVLVLLAFFAQATPGMFIGMGAVYLVAIRPEIGRALLAALEVDMEEVLTKMASARSTFYVPRPVYYVILLALVIFLVTHYHAAVFDFLAQKYHRIIHSHEIKRGREVVVNTIHDNLYGLSPEEARMIS